MLDPAAETKSSNFWNERFCILPTRILQEKETVKVVGISQSAIGDPGQGMCLCAMHSWSSHLAQSAKCGIN